MLAERAVAQAPTVDTSVPTLPGSGCFSAGHATGVGRGLIPQSSPGPVESLGGRPGVSTPKGIPTTISTPGVERRTGPICKCQSLAATRADFTDNGTPFYGKSLEVATQDDDGPPNGLTLDQAIDVTLDRSLDLRAKYLEIPMARADILQANLRSNPIFYQDGQLLQYKGTSTAFSRAAPGGPSQFDTNVTYPLDVSRKRQARTVVATRAERVLEALFQDAVRQRIDDVYGAFVTAVATRQTVRYAEAERAIGWSKSPSANEQRFKKGDISLADLNKVRIVLRTGVSSAWPTPGRRSRRPSSTWDH